MSWDIEALLESPQQVQTSARASIFGGNIRRSNTQSAPHALDWDEQEQVQEVAGCRPLRADHFIPGRVPRALPWADELKPFGPGTRC